MVMTQVRERSVCVSISVYVHMYIYVVGMEDLAVSLLTPYLAAVITDRMKFLLQKNIIQILLPSVIILGGIKNS